jgi:hypothetical protein
MIIRSRGKSSDIFSYEEFVNYLEQLQLNANNISEVFDRFKNDSITLAVIKSKLKYNKKETKKISKPKEKKSKFKTKFEEILYTEFKDDYKKIYSDYISKLKRNIFHIQKSFGIRNQNKFLFYFQYNNKVGFIIQDSKEFNYFHSKVQILDTKQGVFIELFYILHSILKEFKDDRSLIFIDNNYFLDGFELCLKDKLPNIPSDPLQNIQYLNKESFKDQTISVKGINV